MAARAEYDLIFTKLNACSVTRLNCTEFVRIDMYEYLAIFGGYFVVS